MAPERIAVGSSKASHKPTRPIHATTTSRVIRGRARADASVESGGAMLFSEGRSGGNAPALRCSGAGGSPASGMVHARTRAYAKGGVDGQSGASRGADTGPSKSYVHQLRYLSQPSAVGGARCVRRNRRAQPGIWTQTTLPHGTRAPVGGAANPPCSGGTPATAGCAFAGEDTDGRVRARRPWAELPIQKCVIEHHFARNGVKPVRIPTE
jgi:hypothetical protein